MSKENNIRTLFSNIFGHENVENLTTGEMEDSLKSYYSVAGFDERAVERDEPVEEDKATLNKRVKGLINESHQRLSPMMQKVVQETEDELYKEE